jgi:ubiquinone/menaquinone biosynthesis C-methylase UbiE
MSENAFTPALGRFAPTRFYDHMVALTRERLWRALAAMYVAPRPDDVIVDVGCGTGSLALLLARAEPRARIVGLDPDPDVLAVARRKAHAADAAVRWRVGMGDALVKLLGAGSVNTVVSSLVLHQCPVSVKRAVLASMSAVLRPGRKLVIACPTPGSATCARLKWCLRSPARSRSTSHAGSDRAAPAARPRA